MNKIIQKIWLLVLFLASLAWVSPALAATPYLNISNSGNGLNLSVYNADPNFPVQVFYTNPGYQTSYLNGQGWYTDYTGNFSTYINPSMFGIAYGAQIYVVVDGQQSGVYQYGSGNSGCSYNCYGNYGSLSFSQNNVSLTGGQSVSVSIYGGNASYYVSSNSSTAVVQASISGSGLYLTAYNPGTATVTVCGGGYNVCGSVYVTVTAVTYYQPQPPVYYYPPINYYPVPTPIYNPPQITYSPPRTRYHRNYMWIR